jgi:hypothetical protein
VSLVRDARLVATPQFKLAPPGSAVVDAVASLGLSTESPEVHLCPRPRSANDEKLQRRQHCEASFWNIEGIKLPENSLYCVGELKNIKGAETAVSANQVGPGKFGIASDTAAELQRQNPCRSPLTGLGSRITVPAIPTHGRLVLAPAEQPSVR